MKNQMKEMVKINKPYVCKKCNSEMLFFLTKRSSLIDYKTLFSNGTTKDELINKIENRNIKFIKCINCGNTFIIDWRTGWPLQLMDKNELDKFGV